MLLRGVKLFSSGRKFFFLGRKQKKPPFHNQSSALKLQPSNPPITITPMTPTLIYYIENFCSRKIFFCKKTWLFQLFFIPLQQEKKVLNSFTIVKGLKPQNCSKHPPTKSESTLYQVYTNSIPTLW